jgi:hypothetical protein
MLRQDWKLGTWQQGTSIETKPQWDSPAGEFFRAEITQARFL